MWGLVLVFLLFHSVALGQNYTGVSNNSKKEDSNYIAKELNEIKVNEFEFLDEMKDWSTAAAEYVQERSESILGNGESDEEGRRLKYKRAEMKFIMKTLLVFKLILGLFLPVGVIASKIISWKALTLSLMAFMLAKILFIKNLLTGKSTLSIAPTNYAPPFYVHGGINDVFWKRQGERQVTYPWAST